VIEPVNAVKSSEARLAEWERYLARLTPRSEAEGRQQPTQGQMAGTPPLGGGELSQEDRDTIQMLRRRDTDVRSHEQAHLVVAGQYAGGGATYSYRRGPDGQLYAIGGEVPLDMSPIQGQPEVTLRKALQLRRAALAPADPSPQDRQVASEAARMELQAEGEISDKLRAQDDPIDAKSQTE
jgi:hypothetical protein